MASKGGGVSLPKPRTSADRKERRTKTIRERVEVVDFLLDGVRKIAHANHPPPPFWEAKEFPKRHAPSLEKWRTEKSETFTKVEEATPT